MKTDNIKKLNLMHGNRKSPTGYMVNRCSVRINHERLRSITRSKIYDNFSFDPFILKAILENESMLIKRAYEIEDIEYMEVERKAKIEAANILAGTDLLINELNKETK